MDNKELNGLDEWSRVIQVYQRKNEANERRSKKARILLEELENLKRTRDDLKDQINMQRDLRKKPWRQRDDAIAQYNQLI